MEPPEGASPGGQTGEQEPLWIKGNQRPRTHMTNHRTLVWTKVETEIVKEIEVPQAALGTPVPGTGNSLHSPVAEEVGVPAPAPGLLQVTERRQPLSSVSSLEVHFDLLDLTELTDMSDQELAEVFADSDDENLTSDSPAGLHPLPRASCLRSPSWTRTRAEKNREKQPFGDPERQPTIVDTLLTVERPKED
ncbi:Dysbindin domain-containing protein 1 [Camelus dromedarius]|uniref:Dysbindin domain-containing protein 1 n=1 Tax=Camelus dromedarius TaxID=9838 RepID=A0A5N4CMU5_CAMDR|nr:PREDICTED: dysbindin domain-containing protein 1 [Camelus bactrianus]XP_031292591.1 dysbindin domain-containing protein 1 isoform X3 [Camelus dromedarius]KAB1260249.1 Dysbindin domain-containing protein 1 [Camelus dromedarius]